MGRSRLPLELIPKEKSRKITFQKRTMGLKKKTYEISTLCGVDACVIIYSWTSDDRPMEPIFWPSNPEKVKSIINRYKEHSKEERGLKTLDLSGFFEERTKKIQKEISKLGHQGADQTKYPTWDDQLNDLSVDQLRELVNALGTKLEVIKSRVELLKMSQALLEGPASVNLSYPNNAMPSTQSLHVPYPGTIDSMPLVPNPMTPMMNPRMTKVMMTSDNQYTPPLQHPFYYDPTSGLLENIVYSNPGPSSCYYPPAMLPPILPYISNQMMTNDFLSNQMVPKVDQNSKKPEEWRRFSLRKLSTDSALRRSVAGREL
ncbi:Agamous-like MADS-box protein AGL82 [Vitis vinifera]|uniref:Agamous-like MADS-box protein AGL82 n=1 Tax=Vitis vinifera TaxID=29760 RepID=A0A438DTD2_VITVI|nr:Agamous-like MADS-box protein AGL82 [Vitis vinifera]